MTPSFVVTLELDSQSFEWLNALRRRHFPAALNQLDAHLTLFHKLDADGVAAIGYALAQSGWRDIELVFTGPRSLGRGVSVAVASPALVDLRSRLARPIGDRLTAQDRQPFRPHVTIQNKVDPGDARTLMAQLAPDFAPRQGKGVAVQVWKYLGGPWRFQSRTGAPHE